MKKIIKGKKYDTDTAKLVGEWNNGEYGSFSFVSEELYRKRTGEYFLYGSGGARSRYAEKCGMNTWEGGSAIIPLDYKSAMEWAEEHLDADEYEAEFGEVPEGDETEGVVVSLRMPASAKAKIDQLCARTGRSRGDIVTAAIMEYSAR